MARRWLAESEYLLCSGLVDGTKIPGHDLNRKI
jgi:hypothetical protein